MDKDDNLTINYHKNAIFELKEELILTVTKGYVELYVKWDNNESEAEIYHLAHFEKDDLFFSFSLDETHQYFLKLSLDTELKIIEKSDFEKKPIIEQAKIIDNYFLHFSGLFNSKEKPYACQVIQETAKTVKLNQNDKTYSRAILWATLDKDKSITDTILDKKITNLACFLPGQIFKANSDIEIKLENTSSFIKKHGISFLKDSWFLFQNLTEYHIAQQKKEKVAHFEEIQKLERYAKADLEKDILSAQYFSTQIDNKNENYAKTDIYAAIEKLASIYSITIPDYKPLEIQFESCQEEVEYLTNQYRLDVNKINLPIDWYKSASIPYLCFNEEGKAFVLQPTFKGHYLLINSKENKKIKVTEAIAKTIIPTVYALAPEFCEDKITTKSLMRFAFLGNKSNFFFLLTSYLIVALFGLINPIITGYIVDSAIVNANLKSVIQLSGFLIGIGISVGLLLLVRNTLLVRFETLMNYNLQSAIMNRVLKLPLDFFSKYSIGDASSRILAVDGMVKSFTGNNINGMLTFLFSLVSFFLMFYYSPILGFVVLLVITLLLLMFFIITLIQLPYVEKSMNEMGDTYGFMFQVINGISRIKLFARETFVEANWGKLYCQYRHQLFKGYLLGAWRSTFFVVAQLFIMILIFIFVSFWYNGKINFQDFVTFFSAFVQFIAGMMMFSMSAVAIIPAIVYYRRLSPILNAKKETTLSGRDGAFKVSGEITAKNIAFSYQEHGTQVLKDINFTINPGDYVAIVGFSGSGKSTLFKLLLGFYAPTQGSLLIDGHSIKGLDILNLRKQMGVVLQDGKLVSGTILENIIGNSNLTEDDAWQAAELVGLDTFIKALPMGMQTVVSQSMSTFSGGQKQLILLARAIVTRPKILLMDEATSALDNQAQALVSQSINQLKMTRISIAHRLSTIKEADKILVLKDGLISESGTYDYLINLGGFFAQLAKSQSLE